MTQLELPDASETQDETLLAFCYAVDRLGQLCGMLGDHHCPELKSKPKACAEAGGLLGGKGGSGIRWVTSSTQ